MPLKVNPITGKLDMTDGDMHKSVYDTDEDSVVDTAEGISSGAALPATASVGDLYLLTTDNHPYIYTT